tara:strand:+ start:9109 stop:9525 length:417 start_codon:yes stop_codon:yes gene_type:complete
MFKIDERLTSTSIIITDLALSRVFFKNEQNYPWFILIPRKQNVTEIHELLPKERETLINEISKISNFVKNYFNPEKLNVGALGNIVPQLHIHIVGRNNTDPLWPHSIWQPEYKQSPYPQNALDNLIQSLKRDLSCEIS